LISKNEIKRIRSLHNKKGRKEAQQYIVEGEKSVREAMHAGGHLVSLYVLETASIDILEQGQLIAEKDMKQISAFTSFSPALAVLKMTESNVDYERLSKQKVLALDGIRDPGNLGTIIRTADWFGISTVLLSSDCVDLHNPKTLQATMGSFLNVDVIQGELHEMIGQLQKHNPNFQIYGAVLNGEDSKVINGSPRPGLLIIGSESHGISAAIQEFCTMRLTIAGKGKAESLNASIAAAVLLSDWTTN
jgi:TrmH family RNA methyltransferase